MRTVSTAQRSSVLSTFASGFHQDLALMGCTAQQWGTELMRPLSKRQRDELRAELSAFLVEFPGKSSKGLLSGWKRLGAASWPRSEDLRSAVEAWIKELK
jgi:hypothetical protein